MKVQNAKTIGASVLILAALAVAAGIYWAVWMLWCAVFGLAWPMGPDAIVRPGFWLFAGEWLLVALALRGIGGAFRK